MGRYRALAYSVFGRIDRASAELWACGPRQETPYNANRVPCSPPSDSSPRVGCGLVPSMRTPSPLHSWIGVSNRRARAAQTISPSRVGRNIRGGCRVPALSGASNCWAAIARGAVPGGWLALGFAVGQEATQGVVLQGDDVVSGVLSVLEEGQVRQHEGQE
jgi:hypothetical protein